METCLQRTLDQEVFGRAYGLELPASLGGIVAGIPGAIVAVPTAAVISYTWPYLRGDHDHDQEPGALGCPDPPAALIRPP